MFTTCRVPLCDVAFVDGDNCEFDGVCGACTRVFEVFLREYRADLYRRWLQCRMGDVDGHDVAEFVKRDEWVVAIDEWLSVFNPASPSELTLTKRRATDDMHSQEVAIAAARRDQHAPLW